MWTVVMRDDDGLGSTEVVELQYRWYKLQVRQKGTLVSRLLRLLLQRNFQCQLCMQETVTLWGLRSCLCCTSLPFALDKTTVCRPFTRRQFSRRAGS